MSNIQIRPLQQADLDRIEKLRPEGWGPIEPLLRYFLSQPYAFPHIAEMDGQLVGMANGIQNGGTAWLSHIIVEPPFRGRGFGARLTEFILRFMQNRGNKTVLLVATEMGERVYVKFGFRRSGEYQIYTGKTDQAKELPLVRSANDQDFAAIKKFDRRMSGEDRWLVLEPHAKNAFVYERPFPRSISGFYMPTLGEGLIVAAHKSAGLTLLQKLVATSPQKIVVPAENAAVNDQLLAYGFTRQGTMPRMVLGKNVKWRPHMLFNRIGGWFG